MKILMVNKFLYPNGGSETYLFETGKQLQKMGHEVQYFGMEHEGRIVGNHAESYTSGMDFHSGKLAKRLGFQEKEVGDTFSWFEKKGEKAVFFGRCIPIVRSLISIPAGMAGMKAGRFTVYTLTGSLIWDTLLVLLGRVAGESWEIIMEYTDAYAALVKIGAVTAGAAALMRFLGKCRKKGE